MQHYCKQTMSTKSLTQTESLELKNDCILNVKTRLPCMQTMCYWFVDLEKRRNITIIFVPNGDGQNCHILWWAFNCQFKSSSVFPRVADIPGYRFQMPSIQCNNMLDVEKCLFSFWEGL